MSALKIKKGDTVKVIAGKDKDKEGKVFNIDSDSVIMSVGYSPAPVAEKGKHIHVIGDASAVGNLKTVIWGAWSVCMKL